MPHQAHTVWTSLPEIPTLVSLGLIGIMPALVTVTSLLATRNRKPIAS